MFNSLTPLDNCPRKEATSLSRVFNALSTASRRSRKLLLPDSSPFRRFISRFKLSRDAVKAEIRLSLSSPCSTSLCSFSDTIPRSVLISVRNASALPFNSFAYSEASLALLFRLSASLSYRVNASTASRSSSATVSLSDKLSATATLSPSASLLSRSVSISCRSATSSRSFNATFSVNSVKPRFNSSTSTACNLRLSSSLSKSAIFCS